MARASCMSSELSLIRSLSLRESSIENAIAQFLLVRLGPNARISIAVLAVIVVIVVLHKIDLVPENAANATEAFYEL